MIIYRILLIIADIFGFAVDLWFCMEMENKAMLIPATLFLIAAVIGVIALIV